MTKQTLALPPASTTMAAPPPPLMDELVEEILLRLPPSDPASLVRAALVCKPWRRLIAAPAFRRRFHRIHRAPPVLGFLSNNGVRARFLPSCSSSFRLPRAMPGFWRHAIDARHGRVLLHTVGRTLGEPLESLLAVWDPTTGDWTVLPTLWELKHCISWSAAVLCAGGGDGCRHIDCHHGPYQVVVVYCNFSHVRASVYSSEAAVWNTSASSLLQNLHFASFNALVPRVLVENALYFVPGSGTKSLVKYNLASHQMSAICLPPAVYGRRIVLTTMEDGRRLGFAVLEGSKLHLWLRDDAGPGRDAWWIQSRVTELKELLPIIHALSSSLDVVALIDGVGVCFVRMADGVFSIDLKSSQVKKVCDVSGSINVFPYTSFYIPASGATSTVEGPRSAAPSSS